MPIRRVLVCPQEFKGSLDPFEAAAALARGIRIALPGVEVIERPLADGGPGTAAIVAAATDARVVRVPVRGSYDSTVDAALTLVTEPDGLLAIVESAQAVGLVLTPPDERQGALASSEGVGDLIHAAIGHGATRLLICVGGTATSDGGSGVARALGVRLFDAAGQDVPPGGLYLARLARVEDHVPASVSTLEVTIAVDALNPLTGPEGAVAIFGAQKGVRDWQSPALDAAIRRWADVVRRDLRREIDAIPGTGTGGGITAGVLAAIEGARIEPGAALVARAARLEESMSTVDLVVTGEGTLDAQTAYGKTVAHVSALASSLGVPCLAVAGSIEARPSTIEDAEPLALSPAEIPAAMADAHGHAERAAERLLRRWIASHA